MRRLLPEEVEPDNAYPPLPKWMDQLPGRRAVDGAAAVKTGMIAKREKGKNGTVAGGRGSERHAGTVETERNGGRRARLEEDTAVSARILDVVADMDDAVL